MAKTKRRIRSAVAVPQAAATEPAQSYGLHGPVTDEPLVGPTDVAMMLGVPISWVYMKAEAGELPSYKLGHYRRFKRSDIEEYLRACRRSSNGR